MKLILLLILPAFTFAQPKNAKTIIVKHATFLQVCGAILDNGYTIDKKDNDLQTVRTEYREYDKLWNMTYCINVRVKDSTAYITGMLGGSLSGEPIFNQTKNGETAPKSLFGYGFLKMKAFAESLKGEISYE
jgi:hypothetical protein